MTTHMHTDLRSNGLVVKTQLHRGDKSVPKDNLLNLVDRFRQRVERVLPDAYKEELFDRLKRNIAIAQEVAPSHDFEEIKCNGVRMILDHAETYLAVADKKKKPEDVANFLEVLNMLDVWFNFINIHKDLTTTNASVYPKESRDYYTGIYSAFNPVALRTILGPQYHCVTRPGLRLPLSMVERGVIIIAAKTFKDRLKFLSLSRKTIAKTLAQIAPTVTVKEVAGVIRLMDSLPLKLTYATMRAVTSKGKWVHVKSIETKVPTYFKIQIEDIDVKIRASRFQADNEVKMRLLHYGQSAEFKNKLLFYVHGGAFVGPTAAALENFYIKEFASNLKGLTILSMDHPHGPESPFPIALQKVLDTYLWLTSNRHDVDEKLGFRPDEIVLMGDSSGGSIVSSLMVVLNEIKNMAEIDFKPVMPKSLVLLFPKTTLQFDIFPSLMTAVFDQLLSMQLLLGSCIAYIPMLKKDENGNWSYVQDNLSIPMDFLIRDDYKVLESPILSPIRYEKLDQLSDVPLHLMALGNDPLLDESLEMARKWKGRVKLHVVEGCAHGGFIFNYFSRVGCKCVPIASDLIRGAFFEIPTLTKLHTTL